MKRVLLVGSPGAGKSTFARKLSLITGLPIIHLDRYYNDKKLGYVDDEVKWTAFIAQLIAEDEWIIDGNYSGSLEMRLARADRVFVFEYPRWRALLGLARRRLEYHTNVRTDMPDGWRERLDLRFLIYVWKFRKRYKTSKSYSVLSKVDPQKIVTFKRPADVRAYLQNLK